MDDEVYTQTRTSLQTIAEHVLTAALHAATGKIGLRQTPGGFGTPRFPSSAGERRLRVDGLELVIEDDRGVRSAPITTVRAAADFAEVPPGAPADVYTPATPLAPDETLRLDPGAAKLLADWYELTNGALEQLRAHLKAESTAVVQLWPEHFDLAATIAEVNYGGSPGDAGHAEPYLYVGPFQPPVADGDYWNEPFGASVPSTSIADVEEALAFFVAGRRRLDASSTP